MAKRKIPGMERFKRIVKWAAPIGVVFAIIVFALDFFNIYVDFISRGNEPPAIQDGIRLSRPVVSVGEIVPVRVIVKDPNLPDDEIRYFWVAHRGKIGEQLYRFQGSEVIYVAPDLPGIDVISVMVYDRKGETDKDFCIVTVVEAEGLGSP